MFGSSPFDSDPFRRLPFPTTFSYSNYMPHLHPQHAHEPHRQHRHMPNPLPHHHSPHTRNHRRPRHRSHYSDMEPSSSEQDTQDEPYYMSPSPPSPLPSRLHPRRSWKHTNGHSPIDIASGFLPLDAKVSRLTAENVGRDDILILPPTLTRLRVQIQSAHHGSETLHALVAGDMRIRDVVRQLVPEMHHGEVRAYVKMRGAWQEPGLFHVSQIMEQGRFVLNKRGELDVKIEIGGRVGGGGGEGGIKEVKAWEREMGRAWEIRS